MKAGDLLREVKAFRDALQEHFDLWSRSLEDTLPDQPIRNRQKLHVQQKELYRCFYVLDPFLSRYSKGRYLWQPATGLRWDIYRSAIGNDPAPDKGEAAQHALLELEGVIAILEREPPDSEVVPLTVRTESRRRVFISHGKDSKALTKIERFIRGLGLTPVIVRNEASGGRALDDLVEEQMDACECMVALATKDDEVDGRHQPRPNVIHEIGLAQEKLQGRLIYLKEEGCDFPSNIASKVWENFTQDNLENAFLKIGKELRAFGLIS